MSLEQPSSLHHDLSLQSFFNSFSMETDSCQLHHRTLFIPLGEKQLALPLSYQSHLGRHRYKGDIYLCRNAITDSLSQTDRIEFSASIQHIVDHYFPRVKDEKRDRFFNRVGESNRYVKAAYESLMSRQNTNPIDAFIQSEQALIGGHSMHPAPKSCEPLTIEEQHAYLPEYGQMFAIEWFAVDPKFVATQKNAQGDTQALYYTFKQLLRKNLNLDGKAEMPLPTLIEQGWLALPMHPLQAQAWRRSQHDTDLSKHVIDCKIATQGWTATSSSRAIYHPNLAWMLKVSLPVKLTNSLRLLTEKEVKRGVQFSQLLQTNAGKEMLQRMPNTEFLQEPMWASIKSLEGECLDLPLVCLRDNVFFKSNNKKSSYLLASVNQNINNHSQIGDWVKAYANAENISLQQAAHQWLSCFMDNVIAPLCIARSDYGIILLAHQQNILLDIKDNLPTGMKYRDCQGIALTDITLTRFSDLFDGQQPEYFVSQDQVNPYLAYYLIGNSLLNTITAICADHQLDERSLWTVCQHSFSALRQAHPKDPSFYDYLLSSPTLHWKRNFFCFLSDLNEATLDDPSQIYCQISNPFYDSEPKPRIHKPLPLTQASGSSRSLQPSHSRQQRNVCIETLSHLDDGEQVHQRYRLYEHGINKGEFDVIRHLSGTHLDAEFSDTLMWWSALEHAFYLYNDTDISSNQWPEFAKPHLSDNKMSRVIFLQVAPIWHQAHESQSRSSQSNANQSISDISSSTQIAANGISHPTRPDKPVGQVFQRYCYHLKRNLSFRTVDIERDLQIFNQWHNHSQIHPVWELKGSLSMHREYLQKMAQDPHQFAVIGEFDGVAFGYFEVYWAPEDRLGPYYECQDFDRGVHILAGNFDYRGGTFFDAWGKSILHYCFLDEAQTMRAVGEPNAKNHRVVKITERIGMKKQFEFDFPHKRAALLQCERGDFFNRVLF
ncbi:GNAT family N-acetyltransferase [Vibrio sp. S17_S38]|uniref:GNAT family N-acetyltransferase n=1 Tax=Vibrio sp. S17_S38 TaxID=2720229 RepID=UPI001680D25B|nr:GNAT family N-acetyltransferase [Vibrio sp. S17_S38]MBD1573548.1 GNAT family N-acetyltransferase [Vibrio sp. S17_S38]